MTASSGAILVVDDDKPFCDSLGDILRANRYDAVCVYDGEGALETFNKRSFVAVILDIRLPGIDGVELLGRLREEGGDVGVLMLSGQASLEDAVGSLNRGADAFMVKPVEPDDLLARLRGVVEVRALGRRLRESEGRYRALVEGSSDSIVALGLDWTVRFANGSFLGLLGLPVGEVTGRNFGSFMRPFKSKLLVEAVRGAVEEGRAALPRFTVRGADGSPVEVEASTAAMERDGEAVGVLMVLRNVGAREEAPVGRLFRVNGLEPGGCYLEESRALALRAYGNLALHGVPCLLFTRESPDLLESLYGVDPGGVVVVSSEPVEGFDSVSGVGEMGERIDGFLEGGEASFVVLDGLEGRIAGEGFDAVYGLIREKRLVFGKSGSVLLAVLDPRALEDRQKAMLGAELRTAER